MISNLFNQIFFQPLYNLLTLLSGVLPAQSLGGAIITLTLIVKFVLLPLQHKTLKTQTKLKELEPKLQEVKKQYKDDRNEQARQTMALYKAHGVNPLTTLWTLLIQIPIILALFMVFRDSSTIKPDLLYQFIPSPEKISLIWLGFLDLTKSYLPLALLVGITQFIQLSLSLPSSKLVPNQSLAPNQVMMQNMQRQMRYWLPIIIVFASISLPSAVNLYWLTSNLFTIGHEMIVRRQASRQIKPLSSQGNEVLPTGAR